MLIACLAPAVALQVSFTAAIVLTAADHACIKLWDDGVRGRGRNASAVNSTLITLYM